MNIDMQQHITSRALGTLAAALFTLASAAPAADAQAPVFSNPLASTNPYAPFEVGAIKVYRGKDEGAKIHVVDDYEAATRMFLVNGQMVACHLMREVEFEGGELKEISLNYFAEADSGDVYYFGETVDNYEDGVIVDNEGSWLVGGLWPAPAIHYNWSRGGEGLLGLSLPSPRTVIKKATARVALFMIGWG